MQAPSSQATANDSAETEQLRSVFGLSTTGSSGPNQQELNTSAPNSALERELFFDFVPAQGQRRETSSIYRDRFTGKYLSAILLEAKFDPMLNRLHLPPSLWTGNKKANPNLACLPACLATWPKFVCWWVSVLGDLHSTAKAFQGQQVKIEAFDEVVALTDAWTQLCGLLSREVDIS
jgi:hypothetical protein